MSKLGKSLQPTSALRQPSRQRFVSGYCETTSIALANSSCPTLGTKSVGMGLADAANRSVCAPSPPTASIAWKPKREPTYPPCFLQLMLGNAQIDRLATQLLTLDSHVQHPFVSSLGISGNPLSRFPAA